MSEMERETLDLDVVFVGAGPASLAGALHLARLIDAHNESPPDGGEPIEVAIAVLEKGKEIGAHALSGAVLDPRALQELFPDSWQDAPFEGRVEDEDVMFLTESKALGLPIVPPPLKNHGNYVVSLGKLLRWMGDQVEEAGVDIFAEFPASEVLVEGDRVVGVRTGDRGLDKSGQPKANYEPGIDIHTRAVVLGEGVRGTLTKQLEERFDLNAGRNPQVYSVGIKEIWELPKGRIQPGSVIHTMGWPLDSSTYGGSFIYGMRDDQLIVGLVVGLDYRNPRLDPHEEFQRFKTHPQIRPLLEGGKMTHYGAKALPSGGWWSIPELSGDGFLLTGDSAGLLNAMRLKGIHLAMKSGMLAAETIFEGLVKDDLGPDQLGTYRGRIEASWMRKELRSARNFHQGFEKGLWAGMVQAGLGTITGGRGWGLFDRLSSEAGHERMRTLARAPTAPAPVEVDGNLTFDKLADVYNSGTAHEEDQPVHLVVSDLDLCVERCTVEYGNPCEKFCPAAVYEMVDDATSAAGRRLQINASNCVHCKTCDIMDPYQIITWVPPEGGGGPSYQKM